MSTVCPGATLLGKFTDVGPPILVPESNTREYEVVHVHVPMFFRRQVFVKVAFGAIGRAIRNRHVCDELSPVAGGCGGSGYLNSAAGTRETASARSMTAQLNRNPDFMSFSSIESPRCVGTHH